MDSDLVNSINIAKELLENSVKLIADTKELTNHEDYLEKYSKVAEHLLETERRLFLHKTTFQKTRGAQTIPDFDTQYKNELLKNSKQDVKTSGQYKEMMEIANNYFNIAAGDIMTTNSTNVDDDLAIEENIPTVDPLTKCPLENPVKNKICGHIYGKNSMEAAIKQGHIRCPQMGCNNKQYVQMSHLVVDNVLKMKLAALRAKEQAEMEQDEDSDS
ncbi:E3 SUMO-protein ligase NSE2-like [Culicoides brevitarsis]|uniref:E3 SUMO-protein ligase NSE2-like n=1 Tax=Culicoides brevitarsis TaxID=469753 RepID=UPI00307B2B38